MTGNQPVTKSVLYFKFTKPFIYSFLCNCSFGICIFHTVKFVRINKNTFFSVCCIFAFRRIFRILYYNLQRQIIFFSKIKISCIMCRYSHYSTSTVFNKCIVRSPERKFFSIKRIYTVSTKRYTCLNPFCRKSFDFCHFSGVCSVSFNSLFVFRCCKFFYIFVFRCNYKISNTINGVRSCCIYRNFKPFNFFHFELNNCSLRFSNPVCLHCFYIIAPARKFI